MIVIRAHLIETEVDVMAAKASRSGIRVGGVAVKTRRQQARLGADLEPILDPDAHADADRSVGQRCRASGTSLLRAISVEVEVVKVDVDGIDRPSDAYVGVHLMKIRPHRDLDRLK